MSIQSVGIQAKVQVSVLVGRHSSHEPFHTGT